eukprot:IDg3469t1
MAPAAYAASPFTAHSVSAAPDFTAPNASAPAASSQFAPFSANAVSAAHDHVAAPAVAGAPVDINSTAVTAPSVSLVVPPMSSADLSRTEPAANAHAAPSDEVPPYSAPGAPILLRRPIERRRVSRRGDRGRSPGGTGGRRPGQLNYTAEEVSKALDIVEEYEPLGAQMWAEVHDAYALWAVNQGRPVRDADYLKQKVDRLANTNKRTG